MWLAAQTRRLLLDIDVVVVLAGTGRQEIPVTSTISMRAAGPQDGVDVTTAVLGSDFVAHFEF